MRHEEFDSTRVGPYIWDINVEAMEIDELRALEQLCREKRKQKEAEQMYLNKLVELLAEAAEHNVQLIYSNDEAYLNLTAGRFNLAAQEKEYWVD